MPNLNNQAFFLLLCLLQNTKKPHIIAKINSGLYCREPRKSPPTKQRKDLVIPHAGQAILKNSLAQQGSNIKGYQMLQLH